MGQWREWRKRLAKFIEPSQPSEPSEPSEEYVLQRRNALTTDTSDDELFGGYYTADENTNTPPARAMDLLMCGECRNVFALCNIIDFIRHKQYSCPGRNNNDNDVCFIM